MKTQIRHACFETNSSSSHSLTVSNFGRYSADGMPIIKEFYQSSEDKYYSNAIVLTGGEYGWGYESYTDSWEKANYLATHLVCYSDSEKEKEMFEYVLKSETGADNIVYDFSDNDAYIDHQSIGDASDVFELEDKLKNFLFNSSSELIIDNDNH